MKMLWNLPMGDILHLSSKRSGGGRYDDLGTKMIPAKKTAAVVQFMEGPLTVLMERDLSLIAAVNRALDATIESLGPAFQQQLVQFQSLMASATAACADKAIWPYSDTGEEQKVKSSTDCYWNDNGCGFPCLDQYWQANAGTLI